MAEYTGTVESISGSEHEIKIEFDYIISNDGIGWYEYWGVREYDAGKNYMEIEDVTYAAIVHYGYCDTKEECPKCPGVMITQKYNLHKNCFEYYWEHERQISVDTAEVDKIVEDASENYDWKSDISEPEPDYYEDRY